MRKLLIRNIHDPIRLVFCKLILIGMFHHPVTTADALSILALAVALGFFGWAVKVSVPVQPVGASFP